MKTDNTDLGMDGFDPMAIPGSRAVSARTRRRPAADPAPSEPEEAPEPRHRKRPARPAAAKASGADGRPAWLRALADKRLHRAMGVVLVVLATVVFVVTVSHLRNGAADQSAVEGMSISQMARDNVKVENSGGAFGAKLSQWLFADGLGLGAFVLVVWLGMLGFSLLKLVKVRFWSLSAKCLFTAIAVSIVCGLVTYNADSYVQWGGVHGHYVNEWLMSIGNALLAVAVSVCLVGVLCCIFLNELVAGYRAVAGSVRRKREQWRRIHEEERERKIELRDIDSVESEPEPAQEAQPAAAAATVATAATRTAAPTAAAHAATAEGFDIDDDIEGDSEFHVRTRTLDDVAAEKAQAETETPADVQSEAEEEPEAEEEHEAEFVVRAAEAEEAFTIDEESDEPETDPENDSRDSDVPFAELPPSTPAPSFRTTAFRAWSC